MDKYKDTILVTKYVCFKMWQFSSNVFRSAFVRDLFPETVYAGRKGQTTKGCAQIKVSIQSEILRYFQPKDLALVMVMCVKTLKKKSKRLSVLTLYNWNEMFNLD